MTIFGSRKKSALEEMLEKREMAERVKKMAYTSIASEEDARVYAEQAKLEYEKMKRHIMEDPIRSMIGPPSIMPRPPAKPPKSRTKKTVHKWETIAYMTEFGQIHPTTLDAYFDVDALVDSEWD